MSVPLTVMRPPSGMARSELRVRFQKIWLI